MPFLLGITQMQRLKDVLLAGQAHGDVLFRGASRWQNLSPVAGFLRSVGAGGDPQWSTDGTSLVGVEKTANKDAASGYAGLTAGQKLALASPLSSAHVTNGLGYTPENIVNKGAANGYASLDGGGDVPDGQVPVSVERTANKDGASGYAGLTAGLKLSLASPLTATHVNNGLGYTAANDAVVEKTANKDFASGYAGLTAGQKLALASPLTASHVNNGLGYTAANDVAVEKIANKGVANGYAGLDANGLVAQRVKQVQGAVGLVLASAQEVGEDTTTNKLKFRDNNGSSHNLVSEDQTQTLTNKTLTTPVIDSPELTLRQGLDTTEGDLGYDPVGSRVQYRAAAGGKYLVAEDLSQTLANKTLISPIINGDVDGGSSAWATQAEAEAATAINKLMNPLRTKQAITALAPNPIGSGMIVLWTGTLASIPSGWVLCDGNNGSPNLLNRFVKGVVNGSTNPGATGGNATTALTTAELPAHTHPGVYSQNAAVGGGTATSGSSPGNSAAVPTQGSSSAFGNEPPFFAVAFIMKT